MHGCAALHCIEPFIIILPSSRYDLNNVEKGCTTPHHHHMLWVHVLITSAMARKISIFFIEKNNKKNCLIWSNV